MHGREGHDHGLTAAVISHVSHVICVAYVALFCFSSVACDVVHVVCCLMCVDLCMWRRTCCFIFRCSQVEIRIASRSTNTMPKRRVLRRPAARKRPSAKLESVEPKSDEVCTPQKPKMQKQVSGTRSKLSLPSTLSSEAVLGLDIPQAMPRQPLKKELHLCKANKTSQSQSQCNVVHQILNNLNQNSMILKAKHSDRKSQHYDRESKVIIRNHK